MADAIPISIKQDFPPKWGYLIKDNSHVRPFITEITEKAVAILRTPKAQSKLAVLATAWAGCHRKQIRPFDLVRRFQRVLDRVEEDRSRWLLTVMDWTMDDEDDATFFHDPWDRNRKQDLYPIEDDVLQLNGIRVYYLIRDTLDHNPAAHIRKFELIITVVHEFAHLFISHLSYSVLGTREPRLASPGDRLNSENTGWQESGYTFERLLFGGTYNRGWDGSGRDHRFLPGLPLLETEDGNIGISLVSILRITAANIASSPYHDNVITLNHVPLCQSLDPVNRYPSFYADFAKLFGREYRVYDGKPEISEAPPEILLQASKVDIDAVRWKEMHPGLDLPTLSESTLSGSRICHREGHLDTAMSRERDHGGSADANTERLVIEPAPRRGRRKCAEGLTPVDTMGRRPVPMRSGPIRKRRLMRLA